MTLLSVNVNKIAVLRNSRGDDLPSVLQAAAVCIEAGCGGITVHPRPDQRHIRSDDVRDLAALLKGTKVEFNIEGNPFAPPRDDYPGLITLIRQARPAQATLVPDSDGQITSDHGFDLERDGKRLRPLIEEIKSIGCRVSLFMDADAPEVGRARDLGADRIEIYTGPYAKSFSRGVYSAELQQCLAIARRAKDAGLGVNAGHDLNQANLGPFLSALVDVSEVSIGHALIGEAIFDGLAVTVKRYLDVITKARSTPC